MNDSEKNPKRPLSFFMLLEHLCEGTTNYVSGHWGTLTAFGLLVLGIVIFPNKHNAELSNTVEYLMTMISLVLLFLLQRSQSKSTLSLQIKLNELLKAVQDAENGLVNIEKLSEDELREIHESYEETRPDPDFDSLKERLAVSTGNNGAVTAPSE